MPSGRTDRFGLGSRHLTGAGSLTHQPEPGQTLPGTDQPARLARGEPGRLRQPGRGRRAVHPNRHLISLNTGHQSLHPDAYPGGDPHRRHRQPQPLLRRLQPEPLIGQRVQNTIEHRDQILVAVMPERVLHTSHAKHRP